MIALFLVSVALHAPEEKPEPTNWLKLYDGATTFGWKTEGSVRIDNGNMILGGDGKPARATWLTRFGNVRVYFKIRSGGPDQPKPTIEYAGSSMEMEANRSGAFAVQWSSKPTAQPVSISVAANGSAIVSEFWVRPISAEPLLNGKDLTGWTQFAADPKRNQASFTVTPNKELHVLGGPGDLQTDRAFGNFLLQGEFKTASAKVNSGIFFRCIPGEYQNGYECQIQNGIIDNDPTRPLDGGTGGIYRRVPARKVVSKDQEWFTLAVAADGANICTWVNGEPVVAWTDSRPADLNPRKGLRTQPGRLSLQGHNPPMSADLLVRNLRIIPLSE